MPTPMTNTLKPGATGDYNSVVTWEATEQRDMTLATGDDTTETLECYKGDYTADGGGLDFQDERLLISGWTTDTTHTITVKAAATEKHNGTPWASPGGAYTGFGIKQTKISPYYVLSSSQKYVSVEDLILECAYSATAVAGTHNNFFRRNCILANITTAPSDTTGGLRALGRDGEVSNNFILNLGSNGNGYLTDGAYASTAAYHNTVVGFGNNFRLRVALADARNNVGANAVTSDWSFVTQTGNVSNNASEDTSAPGTSTQTSIVVADEFVDSANDDYHLKSTSPKLKGNGYDLSGVVTDDIDGDVRSTPYDIGIDMVAAAAGGGIRNPMAGPIVLRNPLGAHNR